MPPKKIMQAVAKFNKKNKERKEKFIHVVNQCSNMSDEDKKDFEKMIKDRPLFGQNDELYKFFISCVDCDTTKYCNFHFPVEQIKPLEDLIESLPEDVQYLKEYKASMKEIVTDRLYKEFLIVNNLGIEQLKLISSELYDNYEATSIDMIKQNNEKRADIAIERPTDIYSALRQIHLFCDKMLSFTQNVYGPIGGITQESAQITPQLDKLCNSTQNTPMQNMYTSAAIYRKKTLFNIAKQDESLKKIFESVKFMYKETEKVIEELITTQQIFQISKIGMHALQEPQQLLKQTKPINQLSQANVSGFDIRKK